MTGRRRSSGVARRRAQGEQAYVVGRLGGEPRQELVAELLDRVAGEFRGDIAELGESLIDAAVAAFDEPVGVCGATWLDGSVG